MGGCLSHCPQFAGRGRVGCGRCPGAPFPGELAATGRREPETPGSCGPSCSSHRGSVCCSRDPPPAPPQPSSQAEGRQCSPARRATSRGSHHSQEARKGRPPGLTVLSKLLPADPWAAAMLKITAPLPGGVTPESAVSCLGGRGSGGSPEGKTGPNGLLCLHAPPQPGPPDTGHWVSWPRPALKPASLQPWAFTPHGSIRPPRCPLRTGVGACSWLAWEGPGEPSQ